MRINSSGNPFSGSRLFALFVFVLCGLILLNLWNNNNKQEGTTKGKQQSADKSSDSFEKQLDDLDNVVDIIEEKTAPPPEVELPSPPPAPAPAPPAKTEEVKPPPEVENPPAPTEDTEKFSVDERGFWQGLGAVKGHIFDEPLAKGLVEFFKNENVETILELGAGTGAYAKLLKAEGFKITCYDGNPNTQELSEGRCGIIDLSKPIDFFPRDWVLSLEVGEHIPNKFEKQFLTNLHNGNEKGLILSWAVEGQGGTAHVNNHNNDYIRAKLSELGYSSDLEAEKLLRGKAVYGWLKNTIMVFRKDELLK